MAGFGEPRTRLLRTVCAASFVFAIIVAVTTQACSSSSHDPPDESVSDVSQEVAGDCGYTDVCLVHSSCTSWDLNSPGDGLGFSVSSWDESGGQTEYECGWGFPCSGDVNLTECASRAVARRNALIATRPGMSQPALNGFTIPVTVAEIDSWEHGCGPFDQGCVWGARYSCTFHVTKYPTPLTGVHDWCPCTQFQPVECAPSSVVVTGVGHTCALVGGGVQCWGSNSDGQLGNGSNIPHSVQRVQVTGLTSGVYTVSAGRAHNCAIKPDFDEKGGV